VGEPGAERQAIGVDCRRSILAQCDRFAKGIFHLSVKPLEMPLDVHSMGMYDGNIGCLSHIDKGEIGGQVEKAFNSVDSEIMRQAMRQWTTGITVVTSRLGDSRHGMTVSSFISISLAPPLLLVSLQDSSRTCQMVGQSNVFGVLILDQHQKDLSDRFAGRISDDDDRFDSLETYTLATSVPFPVGGLASFDCRVVTSYRIGVHTLFIGDVVALQIGYTEVPLVYYNRAYWQLSSLENKEKP